jgi:hypothetical protein
MEGTETANVSASGMGAITPLYYYNYAVRVITLFRVEIYGGTYVS